MTDQTCLKVTKFAESERLPPAFLCVNILCVNLFGALFFIFPVSDAAASWCSYVILSRSSRPWRRGQDHFDAIYCRRWEKMQELPDTPSTVGVEAGGEKVAQSLSGALCSG